MSDDTTTEKIVDSTEFNISSIVERYEEIFNANDSVIFGVDFGSSSSVASVIYPKSAGENIIKSFGPFDNSLFIYNVENENNYQVAFSHQFTNLKSVSSDLAERKKTNSVYVHALKRIMFKNVPDGIFDAYENKSDAKNQTNKIESITTKDETEEKEYKHFKQSIGYTINKIANEYYVRVQSKHDDTVFIPIKKLYKDTFVNLVQSTQTALREHHLPNPEPKFIACTVPDSYGTTEKKAFFSMFDTSVDIEKNIRQKTILYSESQAAITAAMCFHANIKKITDLGKTKFAILDFGHGTFDATIGLFNNHVIELPFRMGNGLLGGMNYTTALYNSILEYLPPNERKEIDKTAELHDYASSIAESIKHVLCTHPKKAEEVRLKNVSATYATVNATAFKTETDELSIENTEESKKVLKDRISQYTNDILLTLTLDEIRTNYETLRQKYDPDVYDDDEISKMIIQDSFIGIIKHVSFNYIDEFEESQNINIKCLAYTNNFIYSNFGREIIQGPIDDSVKQKIKRYEGKFRRYWTDVCGQTIFNIQEIFTEHDENVESFVRSFVKSTKDRKYINTNDNICCIMVGGAFNNRFIMNKIEGLKENGENIFSLVANQMDDVETFISKGGSIRRLFTVFNDKMREEMNKRAAFDPASAKNYIDPQKFAPFVSTVWKNSVFMERKKSPIIHVHKIGSDTIVPYSIPIDEIIDDDRSTKLNFPIWHPVNEMGIQTYEEFLKEKDIKFRKIKMEGEEIIELDERIGFLSIHLAPIEKNGSIKKILQKLVADQRFRALFDPNIYNIEYQNLDGKNTKYLYIGMKLETQDQDGAIDIKLSTPHFFLQTVYRGPDAADDQESSYDLTEKGKKLLEQIENEKKDKKDEKDENVSETSSVSTSTSTSTKCHASERDNDRDDNRKKRKL